jgi:Mrp family chromosome partitioning ATPase
VKVYLGEFKIEWLVNLILKKRKFCEIIVFLEEENTALEKNLNKLGIEKIFVDNECSLEEIINEIKNVLNPSINLSLEIERLKEIIEENGYEKKEFNESTEIKKDNKFNKNIKNKIIAISGSYGVGKSIITAMFGKTCKSLEIKTLIMDFDVINCSINTLFRVNKYNDLSATSIDEYVNHISKNLDIFCGIDMFFNGENKISYEKVNEIFGVLKEKYDLVIIDTSSETYLKYTRTILSNVDKIIFIVEPTILEIKKAEKLLEIYLEDWGIDKSKINLLFNKFSNSSIEKEILKELFGKFKIIGEIPFSNQYVAISNNINYKFAGLNKSLKILNKINF